jgi:hypothetical protein
MCHIADGIAGEFFLFLFCQKLISKHILLKISNENINKIFFVCNFVVTC